HAAPSASIVSGPCHGTAPMASRWAVSAASKRSGRRRRAGIAATIAHAADHAARPLASGNCHRVSTNQARSLQSRDMPGSLSARTHRARGSTVPRLAGMAVILLLAAGGLAFYLASTRQDEPVAQQQHGHDGKPLSSRVKKAQSVGIIAVGVVRHPLKLL